MIKEQFKNKWYYLLILVLYWGSLLFICITLTLLGWYGGDVQIAGFVWSVGLFAIFWFIKKIFYYFMFRDNILPNKKDSSI